MIIKFLKIISCSSEHPQYPASNLLEYPSKSSWRCAKPNELVATVIFQTAESSVITGLEIGNYQSCIIVVEASTSREPDNWLPIVNHQFLSHDEAANNKFKDQVQLFSKRDLNFEIVNKKFDRVKVTCMQPANPRELFGLEFIVFKTEVVVNLDLDMFGRFKLKNKDNDNADEFKEKYLKLFSSKKNYKDDLKKKINESGLSKFTKKHDENHTSDRNLVLLKSEAGAESHPSRAGSSITSNSLFPDDALPNKKDDSTLITRTLFGDVILTPKQNARKMDKYKINQNFVPALIKSPLTAPSFDCTNITSTKKGCHGFCDLKKKELCGTCNLLPLPKQKTSRDLKNNTKVVKKKEFGKLLEGVVFALSGYVNPQRDEIRRKALLMGAIYNAHPNTTNNKCTHLICAFKNTPKSQQLKGYTKIVDHKFIEDCFNLKKRFPWRRFALNSNEKNQPESEEEVAGSDSPTFQPSVYDQDTDDSDSY